MTSATGGANFTDNRQNHIFCCNPVCQRAINGDTHIFGRLLDQCLGGQHMFNFRSADAKSQGTKGTVRCGMRIAAYDCHAGQGKSLFWANHMDNALPFVIHGEIGHAEFSRIFFQCLYLNPAFFIFDAG